ncbi:MAG: aspartate/glutamate racemase family protein, partial [Candidatus Adiutrix sp.]|nr:aspartate/glutamate racemase family protein [Candidatus Adiutrix sp.]
DEEPLLDSELIEAGVVERARALVEKNPEIGPILLECSCLPPYAHAVQAATGRPVFDFITMINYFVGSQFRKAFGGFY